jgi:hypothetical protein
VYLLSLLVVGCWNSVEADVLRERGLARSLGLVKNVDSAGKCQSGVTRADDMILW